MHVGSQDRVGRYRKSAAVSRWLVSPAGPEAALQFS